MLTFLRAAAEAYVSLIGCPRFKTYRFYVRNISVNEPDKPQVILIAYHFPPAPAIGSLRPFCFYKYLKRTGFRCHVITASQPEQEFPPDVNSIPDESRDVWAEAAKRPFSLRAYSELFVRKLIFPGHVGIMWSIKAASLCHKIVAEHLGDRFVLFSTYPAAAVLLTGLIVMLRKRIPWISDFREQLGIGLARLTFQAGCNSGNDVWRRQCSAWPVQSLPT